MMDETKAQNLYEKAKGKFCSLMAETGEELHLVAVKHGMSPEEARAYFDDSYKVMAALAIAMMRIGSLSFLAEEDAENLEAWSAVCDRLQNEFRTS